MAGLFEPVLAYQFDMAIMSRGIMFENEQHEREPEAKAPPMTLAQCAAKMKTGEIPVQG